MRIRRITEHLTNKLPQEKTRGEEFVDIMEAYDQYSPELAELAKKINAEVKSRKVTISQRSNTTVLITKKFKTGDDAAFKAAYKDCDAVRKMFALPGVKPSDWPVIPEKANVLTQGRTSTVVVQREGMGRDGDSMPYRSILMKMRELSNK